MKINIIGDIAGRYDELMLLLEKMPEADLILCVGDLMDRGPKSRQVIEWFMKTENAESLYGNHEDLMVNSIEKGRDDNWCRNGGVATLENFLPEGKTLEDYQYTKELIEDVVVPEDMIEWLKTRPMYYQTDDLFVSHAPVTSLKHIPQDPYGRDYRFIWNRNEPRKVQDKFMVFGHNGKFRRCKWGDGTEVAMCIDNSHSGRLTGMHWPTRELFSVDFLDREELAHYFDDVKAE